MDYFLLGYLSFLVYGKGSDNRVELSNQIMDAAD
jgi:hypothetical protein